MTTYDLATQYIDRQLEIIKKHGGTPRIDDEKRREAIVATQKTFEAMMKKCATSEQKTKG